MMKNHRCWFFFSLTFSDFSIVFSTIAAAVAVTAAATVAIVVIEVVVVFPTSFNCLFL